MRQPFKQVNMYKIRERVYSEAGYILIGKGKKGYQFVGQPSDFTEEKISLDEIKFNGSLVTYGGITQHVGKDLSYGKLKGDMVKRRYTSDDQIAIMLNGDEEQMKRMQAWREWSGKVAARIVEAKDALADGQSEVNS